MIRDHFLGKGVESDMLPSDVNRGVLVGLLLKLRLKALICEKPNSVLTGSPQ